MKLTVIGTGYAGVVTGACFAEMGNDVLCVYVDQSTVESLKNGDLPISIEGKRRAWRRRIGNLRFREAGNLNIPPVRKRAAA